jgi:hypothetical protein
MSAIVEEIREAYAGVGITLDQPAAFGTYYRLLCTGCGRMVGNVGDKLLPGMAAAIVNEQRDMYASGLLGCPCGHQRELARRSGDVVRAAGRRGAGAPPSEASL